MSEPGIETRVDTKGVTSFRAHVKTGYTKQRSPWTKSLDEARQARATLQAAAGVHWESRRRGRAQEVVNRTPTAQASIYFIQAGDGGPVKIGYTMADPTLRVKVMGTHNHEELTLLGSFPAPRSTETSLHRRFAEHRIRGEWFRPHPDLLEVALGTPKGPPGDQMGHEGVV